MPDHLVSGDGDGLRNLELEPEVKVDDEGDDEGCLVTVVSLICRGRRLKRELPLRATL